MKKSLKPRSTTLTVIGATIAVIAFGGGSAVAGGMITSAQIKNHTIQGIDVRNETLTGTNVRNGSLTGADVADGSLTGADIKDGSLSHNDTGVYYAVVASDAAVIQSSGGVSVTKINTGRYTIDFHRNLLSCAFTATVGSVTTGSDEGQANVAYRSGNANAVWVETHSPDGTTLSDHGFHLIVVC